MTAITSLLDHYRDERWKYQRLAELIRRFLASRVREILGSRPVPILQKEESRAKGLDSLRRNLEEEASRKHAGKGSQEHRYRKAVGKLSLDDIGDLAAARLIFFFRDDLDRIAVTEANRFEGWFGAGAAPKAKLDAGPDNKNRELFGYDSYHADVRVCPGTTFCEALADEVRERAWNSGGQLLPRGLSSGKGSHRPANPRPHGAVQ